MAWKTTLPMEIQKEIDTLNWIQFHGTKRNIHTFAKKLAKIVSTTPPSMALCYVILMFLEICK